MDDHESRRAQNRREGRRENWFGKNHVSKEELRRRMEARGDLPPGPGPYECTARCPMHDHPCVVRLTDHPACRANAHVCAEGCRWGKPEWTEASARAHEQLAMAMWNLVEQYTELARELLRFDSRDAVIATIAALFRVSDGNEAVLGSAFTKAASIVENAERWSSRDFKKKFEGDDLR